MNVDEYAVGVIAYLLLMGDGYEYPRIIAQSGSDTDDKIYL
jgi:hypothetical protein